MHYYYDVLGNFDENYLEFYEWEKNDPFTLIPSLTLLEKRNFINADKIWLFL